MLASVDLSGQWKGLIEVRKSGGPAYESTAAMMMEPISLFAPPLQG